MKVHTLEKGQRVKLSQMGHRNFFYPSNEVETLVEDVKCEWLPYIGGQAYTAVKIPAHAIYVNAGAERYLVVWIEKEMFRAN